ncbi:MAG: flagellar hook assembly protein FlgD [Gemmatimonadota bacterium]
MPNNVVSPNVASTVPPARDAATVGPGGRLGKNEFLKLLVAQMRYQDPLNPMNGQEMATQLAQFSSVEQLVNIEDQLSTQNDQYQTLLDSMQRSTALGMTGRTVLATGDAVLLQRDATTGVVRGEVSAEVTGGGPGTLRVFDAHGREVAKQSLGYVGSGYKTFTVDGSQLNLSEGAYSYSIEVTDANGAPVAQKTYTTVTVDGVVYGSDGVYLTAGTLAISLASVVRILK